jgi:hypothetical protein
MAHIRASDPVRAGVIQRAKGERFQDAFARGLAVTGFERSASEGVYLLERVDEAVTEGFAAAHERIRRMITQRLRRGETEGPEAA